MSDGDLPDSHRHGRDGAVSRREIATAAVLFAGVIAAVGFILVAIGATGNDVPSAVEVTITPAPGATTAAATSVRPGDVEAITELSRLSIDLLPQGRWPELYDSFTPEFQARCSREEFTSAGQAGAAGLGADLPLLAFKDMQTVEVTGDTARVVIIGEIRGKSEYTVEAFFRREANGWKFVPAPNSTGCASFNRL
jgi:hypothetical protein